MSSSIADDGRSVALVRSCRGSTLISARYRRQSRALRRMAGLVFLLVFWVLAGACQRHGVGGFLSYNSPSSRTASRPVGGGCGQGRARRMVRHDLWYPELASLTLHRALRRMAGLVFLLVFWVLAGACQRHGVGGFLLCNTTTTELASFCERSDQNGVYFPEEEGTALGAPRSVPCCRDITHFAIAGILYTYPHDRKKRPGNVALQRGHEFAHTSGVAPSKATFAPTGRPPPPHTHKAVQKRRIRIASLEARCASKEPWRPIEPTRRT